MVTSNKVRKRIENLMKERNMTKTDLYQKSKLSKEIIDIIFDYDNIKITTPTLISLAKTFNLMFSQFLDDEAFD